jgi:MoaA/NifB/PqqE/SkfB family radical SAM enzyme
MENDQQVDLREKVTVFCISVGASSFDACEEALQKQDCLFTLKFIRNTAPMSAAFQQMLNRCETPFYIQVDEDMILKPHAVRTMYEVFVGKKDDRLAFTCFPLWDRHVKRTIIGVKIYDHAIMKKYPYQDVQSCEMNQVKRMQSDGYRLDIEWGGPWHTHQGKLQPTDRNIMGFHGTSYSDREAFERYKDLCEKYRFIGGNDWVAKWPQEFLTRACKSKNCDSPDLWAFLGSVSGLITKQNKGEKNFKRYGEMVDFGELRAHIVNPPTRLDVYTTEKCNFACTFCSRQLHKQISNAPDFSPHLARRVLDMFPSIKTACVAGFGEPLMSPTLPDLLNFFLTRQIGTSLITNGALITQNLNRIPWNRLLYVNVSMNEVTPVEHQKSTGVPGAFVEVKRGISLLVDNGVNVGLSFVINSTNLDRIPPYLHFAKNMKASFVSLMNILPHHNDRLNSQKQEFLSKVLTTRTEGVLTKIKQYRKLAQRLGVNVNAWPTPINLDRPNPRHCRSPFTAIGFDGNGFFSGCCRVMGPARKFGHIDQGSELWSESQNLINLRRELGGSKDLRPECSLCFGNWQRG